MRDTKKMYYDYNVFLKANRDLSKLNFLIHLNVWEEYMTEREA